MSIAPFEPKGDRARWQMVAPLLEGAATDSVISYDDAARELNLEPVKDRGIIQAAIRAAAKHHQKDTGRALEAVPNVGYRVVKSHENLRLAHGHQKRSRKQLQKAHRTVVLTDQRDLSVEDRARFDASGKTLGLLIDYTRRLDIRQRNLEAALGKVSDRTDRNAEEVSDLKRRLDRLEGNGREIGY